MKQKIVTVFYFLAGIANIVSGVLDMQDINKSTKALLMPQLIILVFILAEKYVTLPRLILAVGLIFSWFGDILLSITDSDLCFIGGLAMFLIAQLSYAFVMYKSVHGEIKFKATTVLPIYTVGIGLLSFMVANAGDLFIPIVAYAFCILSMLIMAMLRQNLTSSTSYFLTFIGAGLFVISDSILAIDKFVAEIPFSSVLIMSTYIIAQYMIVRGIMIHPKD